MGQHNGYVTACSKEQRPFQHDDRDERSDFHDGSAFHGRSPSNTVAKTQAEQEEIRERDGVQMPDIDAPDATDVAIGTPQVDVGGVEDLAAGERGGLGDPEAAVASFAAVSIAAQEHSTGKTLDWAASQSPEDSEL
jgi:hypothetical protein